MKLIRFGNYGQEKPGIITTEGLWLDVSAFGEDYTESFFDNDGLKRLSVWLQDNHDNCPILDQGIRLGSPIGRPSKIICIGLNYVDHARESNMAVPQEPIVFFKSTTALVGPNDALVIPRGSEKTDWEVELGVVIGRKASYITKEEALDYVAGYVLHTDYSERAFQLERGGQWVKGKSCDTFAPVGPWLATKEEIADVNSLRLILTVNGKTMQDGNTSNLIFDVPYIVSYLSEFMTLLPGDLISTGTPAGVGLGFNPPIYIKPGDVIEASIHGLGTNRQVAQAWQPA